MKRSLLFFLLSWVSLITAGQDPVIVYAIKGKVTTTAKGVETGVKIGRALMPGTIIKVGKDASLTLLCKKGRQFVIHREGDYPVSKWKDSCKVEDNSITANYLSYIWKQFYAYDPETKSGKKESLLAVSRSPGAENKRKSSPNKLLIEFSKGMDSVNYGDKDFNLSWSCFDYDGIYVFRLFDEKGARVLYTDSTEENFIPISRLAAHIEPGKTYRWNVAAPKAGMIRKRILHCVKQELIDNYALSLLNDTIPFEEPASRFFRVGYFMERKHYLADALYYYEKANKSDPSIHAFRDKLVRFRNEYWVQ